MSQPVTAPLNVQIGWNLFFKWLAMTSVGWTIWVLLVPAALLATVFSLVFPIIAVLVVIPTLINTTPGISVGFFQWLILRQRVRQASLWLISSFLGSVLGAVLLLYSDITLRGHQGAVIGLSIGAMQWLVLSRWRWRSLVWLPVSTVSWALSWNLLFDSLYTNMITQSWTGVLGPSLARILAIAVIPGIALGSMTGLTLIWIFLRRVRQITPTIELTTASMSDDEK